jgi:hypothetical protein
MSLFFLGAVMGDGRCNFSFLFSMGTRTASAGFLLEFFFFSGGYVFILRRHRMIPISGRKDFRFASTFLSLFLSRW